jgi:hypothetical protein
MALYLDRIEGSGYLHGPQGKRHRRVAVITGTSTVNPALVAFLATQAGGMPQYGDPHPAHNECKLTEIEAIGLIESEDAIRVMLTYESPASSTTGGPGGGGSPWTLEEDVGVEWRQTQKVPGSNAKPLELIYSDRVEAKFGPYVASMTYCTPQRIATLTGVVGPSVNLNAIRRLTGYVNSTDWNDLPMGYWLQLGVSTRKTAGSPVIAIQVKFGSRNTENWSEYIFQRDLNTDQFYTVSDEDMDDLETTRYGYGILYPSQGGNTKGVAKVGPYKTVDFNTYYPL